MAWSPTNDGQNPNWSTDLSSGLALDSVFGFGAFCETAIAGSSPTGGWGPVNEAQNPNWGIPSDSQTPSWTNVNDGQNPNWVPVPT